MSSAPAAVSRYRRYIAASLMVSMRKRSRSLAFRERFLSEALGCFLDRLDAQVNACADGGVGSRPHHPIDGQMFQVGPMLPEAGAVGVVLEFAEHARLGDGIVRTQSAQCSNPALEHVHAVACDEQQPVRESSFAVGVSPATDGARHSLQRLCGAEDGCQEFMFRGFLARIPLGLPLGKVPVRSRGLHFLLREGGPVSGIEVHAPSRYGAAQFIGLRCNLWFLCRVSHDSSLRCCWNDQRFDDAVEFVGHEVISLGDLVQRDTVRDHFTRLQHAILDVLEETWPLSLHGTLVAADGQPLVHRVAELDGAEQRTERTDHADIAALANGIDGPVQRHRGSALKLELRAGHMLEERSVCLCAHGFDADVSAQEVGRVLDPLHDVVYLSEVDGLGVSEGSCELQPVVDVVDHDDAPRSHEPGRLRGKESYRSGAEHHYDIALTDLPELCAEVSRRARVGQENRIFFVHPIGYLGRTYVSEGNADELCLSAVIAAASMRVAIYAADGACVGIDVVTEAVHASRTEETRT